MGNKRMNAPWQDLLALASSDSTGPLWGAASEDLNCTFLAWNKGQGVTKHVNDEVDVVMVVLAGDGELTIDGQAMTLAPGTAVVLPKGAERSIRATGGRLAYLNVHKRRRGLMPKPGGRPQG